MLSESAKKLVAEQRRIYVESMPSKERTIQRCMRQVKAATQSGETGPCDELFLHVHRLAGSAGSYGFEALGQAASSVDRYLVANSPGMGDFAELTVKLQKLLNELDKAIQTRD